MSRRSGGGGDDDITSHDPDDLDDDIEKSVPLSSLAWEAFELSSDWSKSLKGKYHSILKISNMIFAIKQSLSTTISFLGRNSFLVYNTIVMCCR